MTWSSIRPIYGALIVGFVGVSVSGCGGSGSSSSTATPALSYGTPVALETATGTYAHVVSHSSDNRLVGNIWLGSSSSGAAVAAYWPSPTGKAVLLPSNQYGSLAMAVNDSGVVVGEVGSAAGAMQPAVWSTSTSNPILLPMPPGSVAGEATSINHDGAIVGMSWNSGASVYTMLYWANAKATNYKVINGGTAQSSPLAILNSGEIVAGSDIGPGGIWTNYAGTPSATLNSVPSSSTQPKAVNANGLVVGVSGNPAVATIWAPGSYAATPALGVSSLSSLSAVNDAGGYAGITSNGQGATGTYIWQPNKAPTSLSSLLPKLSPGKVDALLNDYSLVIEQGAADNVSTDYYVPALTHP